jgi:raffinose/stachyose/melibiose transport system substrate-binding protein
MSMRYRFLLLFVIFSLVSLSVVGVQAQERTVVTWWTETFPDIENINIFVNAFNEAHPDIELQVTAQENLDDSLRTAIQAGQAPDILQTAGGSFIAEFVPAGVVKPLTEYAEQYGWSDKLLPWAYQVGFLEDELYSIPLTYETMVMLYNKTLFEQNGWQPPTTRAELEALTQQMQDTGIHSFSYGYAGWEPTNEHLVGIYLNNYAGPDNVYKALIGEKSWTDPEFVEAINMLKEDMVDRGWFAGSLENYYTYGWDDFFGELSTGDAGMLMIGTWGFRGAGDFFTPDTGNDWDWAPLPPFSEMAGPYNYELAIGSTLSINGNSANPDAAAQVLDFLLSNAKLDLEVAATANFGEWVVPLHYTDADYPEGMDERVKRFYQDFSEQTGAGHYGYTTWTFWPADADVQLWKDIELVWAGEMSAEDYLAAHQAEWDTARANGTTLPIPER